MHSDPIAIVLLQLAFLLTLGLLGRFFATKLDQPGVLGELLAGIVAANAFHFFGGSLSGAIKGTEMFASLGVILLIFFVGLETDLKQLLATGRQAALVAAAGVAAPLLLGFGSGILLHPASGWMAHLFMGATLCATSIGITARVLKDLGKLNTAEARLILGAAVIDDVLGLIILGVVSGIAASGQVEGWPLVKMLALTAGFLGLLLWRGEHAARLLIKELKFLDLTHARLLLPLMICFALAWLTSEIGLAAIVGAFAAGLVMPDKESVRENIAPLESVFAPVFFVAMGLQVNLASLIHPGALLLALVLCVASIAGKLVCAFVTDDKVDGLSVGIGMLPRGEVGLIFASAGRALDVLDTSAFAAIITVVIVTTVITPPALRWSLARR